MSIILQKAIFYSDCDNQNMNLLFDKKKLKVNDN